MRYYQVLLGTTLLLLTAACASSPPPPTPITRLPTLVTPSPAATSPRPLLPTATGNGTSSIGASATARADTYLVKAGDTLSSIAAAQGVPLPALLAANPTVVPENLQIGQQLVLPSVTPTAVSATATRTATRTTPGAATATTTP
jgi:LysM repeat protein